MSEINDLWTEVQRLAEQIRRVREVMARMNPEVDRLVSHCLVCGEPVDLDYVVDDEYWERSVPKHIQQGVVCLGCLAENVGGTALDHVQILYVSECGNTRAFLPIEDIAAALGQEVKA